MTDKTEHEKIDREQLKYRKCVGVILLNKDGQVFVGQRIDNKADAWQMPQGGIEEGEDYQQAALRELKEEIGTNNVEIIATSKNWHSYDIPDFLIPKFWEGQYRGQTQLWFIAKFLGTDADINIKTEEPEFRKWQWAEPAILPNIIVPFKRELYKNLLIEFQEYLKK